MNQWICLHHWNPFTSSSFHSCVPPQNSNNFSWTRSTCTWIHGIARFSICQRTTAPRIITTVTVIVEIKCSHVHIYSGPTLSAGVPFPESPRIRKTVGIQTHHFWGPHPPKMSSGRVWWVFWSLQRQRTTTLCLYRPQNGRFSPKKATCSFPWKTRECFLRLRMPYKALKKNHSLFPGSSFFVVVVVLPKTTIQTGNHKLPQKILWRWAHFQRVQVHLPIRSGQPTVKGILGFWICT